METEDTYITEYNDKTSAEYIAKVKTFTTEMTTYYNQRIQNFSVENVTLSVGSAISKRSGRGIEEKRVNMGNPMYNPKEITNRLKVKHNIILVVPNEAGAEEKYNNSFKNISSALETLKHCTSSESGCPTFSVFSAEPKEIAVDGEAVCQQTINPDIAKYFESYSKDGEYFCVTACDSRHNNHKNCNSGKCVVTRSGPSCYCKNTDSIWYLTDCNYPIHKTGLYTGISVTAGVVLVMVGVLIALLVVNKKKEKRNKDTKQEMVNQWLEDDFEWPTPNAMSTTTPHPGTYDNPAYTNGVSNIYQHSSGPLPSYNPNPQSNERYPPPYSPTEPQNQMHNFSSNQPVRINRPQIRTSYDL
ncbi:mucin-17 [Coregonus clupeaformis]|uniref:mucin-17 n=1 Tax=Coregonus clupeaformis TaxID=59861 RepID=UPI001E1C37DA|nr:mucin-17 [Coregonus clupeaformis]